MTNYKEILRLHYGGFSQRAIANSLTCSRDAVTRCLKRAKEKDLTFVSVETMTNTEISRILYGERKGNRNLDYLYPNFEKLTKEIKKPHVTRGLLWREYLIGCQQSELKPYSLTQFNALFRDYAKSHNLSLKQEHRPGESLELDWSGSSMNLFNNLTEEVVKCHLFVAAFPSSGYFYVEAFPNERIHCWIQGIVNALSFFGGVPVMLRPDNCKTATIKADKYEPELHPATAELAEYYHTAVIPARVRRPRDKNVVEATVGFVSRQIIAALRNQKFFALEDMNQTIWDRMDQLNEAPFSKKEGSRKILFDEIEAKELLPLPPKPFELFERYTATVAPDYHIQFDGAFYSVPPKYIRNKVSVRASSHQVQILYDEVEIALHTRCRFKGQKATDPHHIPSEHRDFLAWSGSFFLDKALRIGPQTVAMIKKVLISRDFEVQSYRTCAGILRIASRFDAAILEEACTEALQSGLHSYKAINTLAKTLQDSYQYTTEELGDEEGIDLFDVNSLYCVHEKPEVRK